MTELPEYVYLVTVDTEWPVSIVVDYRDTLTGERVEDVVKSRRENANVSYPEQVHVWKARLTDVREVDLLPSTTVRASLRDRGDENWYDLDPEERGSYMDRAEED